MKKINLFLIVTFLLMPKGVHSASFTLITMLYNEKNPQRIQEYIHCLEKNLQHDHIATIHVIYDTSNDDDTIPILDYLKSQDVIVTYKKGRATYGDCFRLSSNEYSDSNIIIANADIYFNATLNRLDNYDLTNKFLALTRWDVDKDGRLVFFRKMAFRSQDAWIYKTPIGKIRNDNIFLGIPHCDNRIAREVYMSGFNILNPSQTIQCCHMHLSGVRHYGSEAVGGLGRSLPVSSLK